MTNRTAWVVLLILLVASPFTHAQSELEDLIMEREQLYDSYDYLKDKRSSFFGAQSKKDLRKIVGNLKEIILMDSEIIGAIKRRGFQQKNDLILGNRNSSTRNYDLEAELAKYKNLSSNSVRELKEIKKELATVDERKFKSDLAIFVLILIILGFSTYTWKRRKR